MSCQFLRPVVVVALLLVGGCATLNPLPPTQTTLLDEYRQVRSWSATQTESSLREREQLYAQAPSDSNRVRLALALGFGKGAATDSRRAIQLFDEGARTSAVTHESEALFAEILKERLQAEARIAAAEAKVGAAEARAGAAEARVSALNRQAESERERADELERKLEALKSIEKSLHKR